LFCVQIDYFAMNLALPRMASDLGSTTTDLQWVISVCMLALGAFMAPAGRIGDIFGRRSDLSGVRECPDEYAARRKGQPCNRIGLWHRRSG
jgi:MFS family permease